MLVRPGGPYLSPDLPRGQKSLSPAIDLVGRVLREQGLGRHIDDDFIAAATTEMQEAMNMTPAEFEAAAAQLKGHSGKNKMENGDATFAKMRVYIFTLILLLQDARKRV